MDPTQTPTQPQVPPQPQTQTQTAPQTQAQPTPGQSPIAPSTLSQSQVLSATEPQNQSPSQTSQVPTSAAAQAASSQTVKSNPTGVEVSKPIPEAYNPQNPKPFAAGARDLYVVGKTITKGGTQITAQQIELIAKANGDRQWPNRFFGMTVTVDSKSLRILGWKKS